MAAVAAAEVAKVAEAMAQEEDFSIFQPGEASSGASASASGQNLGGLGQPGFPGPV